MNRNRRVAVLVAGLVLAGTASGCATSEPPPAPEKLAPREAPPAGAPADSGTPAAAPASPAPADAGSSSAAPDAPAESGTDVVAVAEAAGNFKTLTRALNTAELISALRKSGPFTLFAPTDAAFASVPEEQLKAILRDHARLKEVLRYHVVEGRLSAADLARAAALKTLHGADLAVKAEGGAVTVCGAKVTRADVGASNGVLHAIDALLLPPETPPAAPPETRP